MSKLAEQVLEKKMTGPNDPNFGDDHT